MTLPTRCRAVLRHVAIALLGAALAVGPLRAQPVPSPLPLAEALRLAREYNPEFLSLRNDQAASDWGVRDAYASFLPTVSANGGVSYTGAGVQTYNVVNLGSNPGTVSSGYSLSLNWSLDGNSIFAVPSARASRRATAATIEAQAFVLEAAVTQQYMAALRAADELEVAVRQLARADQNLGIVRSRVSSGAAAGIEGKQAEVERGRAQVVVIRAEQQLRNQTLVLMERIGVPLPDDVELVREFEIFEPTWTLEGLVDSALSGHPTLGAMAARTDAAKAGVRQARSSYFPRLSVSTSFSGYTNEQLNADEFLLASAERGARSSFETCTRWLTIQNELGTELPGLDLSNGCGTPLLSEAQRQSVLSSNDVFPFGFSKSPFRINASVSIPLFQGFNRERQVAAADAAAKDAEYAERAEELRVRRFVTEAYGAMSAAWEVVRIEERNVELAQAQLEAALQRYTMGAAASAAGNTRSTFLELLDAQASLSTAERDHLDAVYDFHQSIAQLEEATGRSLTPADAGGN